MFSKFVENLYATQQNLPYFSYKSKIVVEKLRKESEYIHSNDTNNIISTELDW